MGPKITVDSATLANEGLKVIEAHWLSGLPYAAVEVVVHPTSIVHSLVRLGTARCSPTRTAGHARADLVRPDLPGPGADGREPLDLVGLSLGFEAVDGDAFPLLGLAHAAGEQAARRPAPTTRRTRLPCRRSSTGGSRSSTSRRSSRRRSRRIDCATARDLDDLVAADEAARRLAAKGLQPV